MVEIRSSCGSIRTTWSGWWLECRDAGVAPCCILRRHPSYTRANTCAQDRVHVFPRGVARLHSLGRHEGHCCGEVRLQLVGLLVGCAAVGLCKEWARVGTARASACRTRPLMRHAAAASPSRRYGTSNLFRLMAAKELADRLQVGPCQLCPRGRF